jgi:hypothetical protein
MWANFISHCDRREQYFTISEGNYFTFCRKAKYFTENARDQISNAKAAFRLLFVFRLFGLRVIIYLNLIMSILGTPKHDVYF